MLIHLPKVNNKKTDDNKKVSTVKKNKTSIKKKNGRKSKYETHVMPNLERIPKWRRDGMTEEWVAKKCGVAYSTLKEYINKYSALSVAIKKGRENLVEELEDSLYKRAMGFSFEEIKEEYESNFLTKKTKTIKFVAPDTGALIFALKNLRGDKWKNHDSITITDENDDIVPTFEDALKGRVNEVD